MELGANEEKKLKPEMKKKGEIRLLGESGNLRRKGFGAFGPRIAACSGQKDQRQG